MRGRAYWPWAFTGRKSLSGNGLGRDPGLRRFFEYARIWEQLLGGLFLVGPSGRQSGADILVCRGWLESLPHLGQQLLQFLADRLLDAAAEKGGHQRQRAGDLHLLVFDDE